jgi:hypothetical protein
MNYMLFKFGGIWPHGLGVMLVQSTGSVIHCLLFVPGKILGICKFDQLKLGI